MGNVPPRSNDNQIENPPWCDGVGNLQILNLEYLALCVIFFLKPHLTNFSICHLSLAPRILYVTVCFLCLRVVDLSCGRGPGLSVPVAWPPEMLYPVASPNLQPRSVPLISLLLLRKKCIGHMEIYRQMNTRSNFWVFSPCPCRRSLSVPQWQGFMGTTK